MKSLYLILFFLFPIFTEAQPGPIDSLEQVAEKSGEVSERTAALFELAATFIAKDPEKSRGYSTLCIDIAEKAEYQKGLGDCLNAKGLLHFYQAEYDSAEVIFHRLEDIGLSENDTVFLYKAYGNLGLVYRSKGQSEEAVKNFLKSIQINEAIGNKRAVAKLLSDVGGVYMITANWPEAMKYQRQSIATYREMENDFGMARVENSIGIIFQEQMEYDSALY